MNQQNNEKAGTSGVQPTTPNVTQGGKQKDNERTTIGKAHGDHDDEVLPAEEIGNVRSGLAGTPDRPEPANGDRVADDRD